MLHAVADAMADARNPVVLLGQGEYTREWPEPKPMERDTLETIVRREREDLQDHWEHLTDNTLRLMIQKYANADSQGNLFTVAEMMQDGHSTRLVQAMILALYAELERRKTT